MEIHQNREYPSCTLSNIAPNTFTLDGIECGSMEGLLQSLACEDIETQKKICGLDENKARFAHRKIKKDWKETQILWWQGTPMEREGIEYQSFLDEAYQAMYEQSQTFRNALDASGNALFTQKRGKDNKKETLLTRREFFTRLGILRGQLRKQQLTQKSKPMNSH